MYSIETNDIYGRFLVAGKDLKPGEVILQENPTIIGAPIEGKHICFKCAKILEINLVVCKNCKVATICGHDCKGNKHTEEECEALKSLDIKTQDFINDPQIVMPMRFLTLRKNNYPVWEEIMKLESHIDSRKDTPIWNYYNESVVKVMKTLKLINDEDIKNNLIQTICGILDVNTFELRAPNSSIASNISKNDECLRGLYLTASLMTHDCIGNTHLSINDDFLMIVRASVPISKGETIYFNYGNCLKPTFERRTRLESGKYFSCNCKRCSDPTELGTNLSSLRCLKCNKGLCVPINPLKEIFKDLWRCQSCKSEIKGQMVRTMLNVSEEKINGLTQKGFVDVVEGEKLLKVLLSSLWDNHYLIIELKQLLIMGYEGLKSEEYLKRKIGFIEDVLGVLKIVEPGISRLQGIAYYQLQSAKVILATKQFQRNKISLNQQLERLKEAEKIMLKSLELLIYEPKNSPEGKLLLAAFEELKRLRCAINNLKSDNKR